LLGRANGIIHDIIGDRYGRFPGRELSDDSPFQFIGSEYMKAEEYDQLIRDPIEFKQTSSCQEHAGASRGQDQRHISDLLSSSA
jgi:hypothetical protein